MSTDDQESTTIEYSLMKVEKTTMMPESGTISPKFRGAAHQQREPNKLPDPALAGKYKCISFYRILLIVIKCSSFVLKYSIPTRLFKKNGSCFLSAKHTTKYLHS